MKVSLLIIVWNTVKGQIVIPGSRVLSHLTGKGHLGAYPVASLARPGEPFPRKHVGSHVAETEYPERGQSPLCHIGPAHGTNVPNVGAPAARLLRGSILLKLYNAMYINKKYKALAIRCCTSF